MDAAITPVYGQLTCALKMEVCKAPFNPLVWRHAGGTTFAKMDDGAKFLGRYHMGKLLSGTLIISGEATFVYGEHNNGV